MNSFVGVMGALVEGGLIPLIVCCIICRIYIYYSQNLHRQAIYPTIIIILVALNRSFTDKEFRASAIDALLVIPIRPPLIGVGPTEVPQQGKLQCASLDVLDIRPRNPGDEEGSEEPSLDTAVKQKMVSDYVV